MAKPPAPPSSQGDVALPSEAALEQQIEKILEGKVQKRELPSIARTLTQIVVSESFSGPMPHPKHLREYDILVPGAGERILVMAEKTLDHNISNNQKMLDAEIKDRRRGMYLGGGVFILLIGCAFASIFVTESPVVPIAFLSAAAIGGVTALIKGRNGQ